MVGNRTSETLDLKIFWRSMLRDPPSFGSLRRSQFPRCAYTFKISRYAPGSYGKLQEVLKKPRLCLHKIQVNILVSFTIVLSHEAQIDWLVCWTRKIDFNSCAITQNCIQGKYVTKDSMIRPAAIELQCRLKQDYTGSQMAAISISEAYKLFSNTKHASSWTSKNSLCLICLIKS